MILVSSFLGFKSKHSVLFQNLLLEIGWNKSESMQKDLEKSLDCCDFHQVNYNESKCEAVRTTFLLFDQRLVNYKAFSAAFQIEVS